MRTARVLDRLAARIENASALDGPADTLAGLASKLIRPGPVEDTLSGVPAGHPVHPALVAVPIGSWVSAAVLDAVGEHSAAQRLTGFGVLSALPTAATGASDWLSTEGPEKRIGFAHALANYVAIGGYGASWLARRRGRHAAGVALSAVAGGALGLAGWLGGHLAYAQGVGVDTTVFSQLPTEWTDVAAASELPLDGSGTAVDADGVPVLVVHLDDRWHAIADRCTHRGGPLSDGEVEDGCVTCPWHGSGFALEDGAVRSGPATRPQPVLETRVRDGRLEVRSTTERSLARNPTGV